MINYVNDEGLATAAAEIKSRIGSGSASAGGLQIEKYIDEPVSACVSVSNVPVEFSGGAAVVLDNEIHILGGDGDYTKHYKYNGSSWESVSTLPYSFRYGSAVVYNNEIHILGGKYTTNSNKKHYKYNGSSWESVSTLPYEFEDGSAIVSGNRIYILGSSYTESTYKNFYSYYNSSWTSHTAKLPYDFFKGAAVVLDNKIHILGGNSSVNHYKYSNGIWKNVSTLPYSIPRNFAVVYGNDIHIFGGRRHYVVKSDNRRIATMLPKGAHIMLSDNEDINYISNATKISSNVAEVTETGYVELLASMPEIYAAKGYLTFY